MDKNELLEKAFDCAVRRYIVVLRENAILKNGNEDDLDNLISDVESTDYEYRVKRVKERILSDCLGDEEWLEK